MGTLSFGGGREMRREHARVEGVAEEMMQTQTYDRVRTLLAVALWVPTNFASFALWSDTFWSRAVAAKTT